MAAIVSRSPAGVQALKWSEMTGSQMDITDD
jgi:hypothetical protein